MKPSSKRILFLSIISVVHLLLFQNCSSIESGSDSLNFESKLRSLSGNGGGYGGKPGLTLYRFVPKYACEDQAVSPEKILFTQDGGYLQSVSVANSCQSTTIPVSDSSFSVSPFQNQFVLYDDRLFTAVEGEISSVPDQLAEALCRDDFSQPLFEVVTFYDRKKEVASLNFYGDLAALQNINGSALARLFTKSSVVYQDASSTVEIQLDQPLLGYQNRFKGKVQSKLGAPTRDMVCVLGGGLDMSFFKFELATRDRLEETLLIEDQEYQMAYLPPEKSDHFVIQKSGQRAPSLVESDGKITDLHDQLLRDCKNCRSVKTNDNGSIMVAYDTDEKNFQSFYAVDITKRKSWALSNSKIHFVEDFWVTSTHIVILTANEDPLKFTGWSYSIQDGSWVRLFDVDRSSNAPIWDSRFFKASNHLLIWDKRDLNHKLIVVDLEKNLASAIQAQDLQPLSPILTSGFIANVWGRLLSFPGLDQLVFCLPKPTSPLGGGEYFVFDPDELTVRILGKSQLRFIHSLSMCTTRNSSFNQLLPRLPADISATVNYFFLLSKKNKPFSEIDGSYYFHQAGADGLKLFKETLGKNGSQLQQVCSESGVQDQWFMTFLKTPKNRLYFSTFHPVEKRIDIFQVIEDKCRRVNSFPFGKWGPMVDYVENEHGVGLIFNSVSFGPDRQHMIFAPFNGRSPIELNSEFLPFAKIDKIISSNEGEKMFLVGQDYRDGLKRLYSFNPY